MNNSMKSRRNMQSVATLGEPGNLAAPPGSRPWAIAMHLEIQACLNNSLSDVGRLGCLIEAMEQHAGYRQLPNEYGQPFASYREFCEAKTPWGLGYSSTSITRLINERKSAQAQAEEVRQQRTREEAMKGNRNAKRNKNSVRVSNTVLGTTPDATYYTAVIARDHPDIHDRMKRGEYASVEAAAVDAGIRKRYWKIPRDVSGAAQQIRKHFTPEQIHELVALLGIAPEEQPQ
jgi:hypothetical protein